jgi:hypothetical protein
VDRRSMTISTVPATTADPLTFHRKRPMSFIPLAGDCKIDARVQRRPVRGRSRRRVRRPLRLVESQPPSGYKVIRIRFENRRPVAAQDFSSASGAFRDDRDWRRYYREADRAPRSASRSIKRAASRGACA